MKNIKMCSILHKITVFKPLHQFMAALFLLVAVGGTGALAGEAPVKTVLVLFEGSDVPANYARGDARELGMLLGHFDVEKKIQGADAYTTGEMSKYDITFFVGFSKHCDPPDRFLRDVLAGQSRVVWLNTGMEEFSRTMPVARTFGFSVTKLDTVMGFDHVTVGKQAFTKGEPNLNLVAISDREKAQVLATASSPKSTYPYMVKSGNLLYVADSPFGYATETDRYAYFADYLHELLGQPHEQIHRALIRIEDISVFDNPARLRAIADFMWSKDIPFLVGVIPFFVDRQAGINLSLSDKPELVDALHYMIAHGATIVMHGVTHQYQGVTATDFEFWDGSTNKKIRNDSKEYVEKKIRMGLEEFWKNNIFPLVWETPHYTASQLDYSVFPEFFSTAMEQRLVIDDADYSQYMPYIIEQDLFGQKILPENLGYIPYSDTESVEEAAVHDLLNGAQAQLVVRDGFASAFIHSFVDLHYIEEYVDGVLNLGYTFMDVKNEPCAVRTKDHVVLTGSQDYRVTLEDQYLRRTWLQPNGDIERREITPERINGPFSEHIDVPEGRIFVADPTEFRETQVSWFGNVKREIQSTWDKLTQSEESYDEIRVALLWDPKTRGSGLNNQASFAAVFSSLNVDVDTLSIDTIPSLKAYNLLVVPYHTVEKLSNTDYDKITEFVAGGGNCITDGKNGLAEEFGVKFAGAQLSVERMRDRLFPDDPIVPRLPEIMTKFDAESNDKIFCLEERTEAPVVIGRKYGDGKFLFIGIRFDPISNGGYSRFPYLMEYIRNYFHLQPILRRDNLEVYFDDGYRHNISIEDLVKRWTTGGVRVVHVVGWHQYKNWTYDYGRLIALCHANGILVYAWLDPPQVSEKFWKDHPEWQEQNYKGEAIRPSWRYPVALTNRACLDTVKNQFKDFLMKYDWDGVNLAELYFEAGNGVQDPKYYTPMHPSARADFRRIAGFDPVQLFDQNSPNFWKTNPGALKKFEDYRVSVLARLHEELLKTMQEIQAEKPYFEVIVTAMDNIGSPELRANNGVDIQTIIDLEKRYRFVLQVEDPQSEWSKDPRRYNLMAQRYRKMVPPGSTLMVDLNILQFRDEKKPTAFPTLLQTGVEAYELVASAARGADRLTIYCESSVRPQDLRMMSYAASSRARLDHVPGGWQITSPFPVVLELPKQYTSLKTSTGERITSDQGLFYLPAGSETVRPEMSGGKAFYGAPPSTGRLLSLTGDLTELQNSSRSVAFTYHSETRCLASFSHRPFTLFVDGKESGEQPMQGYRRYTVMLPQGEHKVIAVLETTVSYGVDVTSFWSSWIIVAFGVLSGAILLTFYTMVRFTRSSRQKA
jgi:uncharacterized protein YdaL